MRILCSLISIIILSFGGASAADLQFFVVEKIHWFWQNGDAVVVPATNSPALYGSVTGPYSFFCLSVPNAASDLLSGSVRLPDGMTVREYINQGPGDHGDTITTPYRYYGANFSSQAALDAAYPDGAYRVDMATTHDGAKHSTQHLLGSAYPAAPRFVNYAASQAIQASEDFVVQWSPFTTGTPDDVLQFRVFDAAGRLVYTLPSVGPGSLATTSTSTVIPALTLAPGQEYRVQLLFLKVVDFNLSDYPGVYGAAEYDSATTMTIKTLPPPTGKDVVRYGIEKIVAYNAVNGAEPVLASDSLPFGFRAQAKPSAAGSIFAASIKDETGQVRSLSLGAEDWAREKHFLTEAELNTGVGSGLYTLTIIGKNDGTKTLIMGAPTAALPPPARFAFDEPAVGFDTTKPAAISWSFTPEQTSAADFIFIRVVDALDQTKILYQSPDVGVAGALSGLDRYLLLPANTLTPGHPAILYLRYYHILSTDLEAYPGATGIVATRSETRITLQAAEAGTTPPVLSDVRLLPNGNLQFVVNGIHGRNYEVQGSVTLNSGDWSPVSSQGAPAASFTIEVPPGVNTGRRFYRLLEKP